MHSQITRQFVFFVLKKNKHEITWVELEVAVLQKKKGKF